MTTWSDPPRPARIEPAPFGRRVLILTCSCNREARINLGRLKHGPRGGYGCPCGKVLDLETGAVRVDAPQPETTP